MAWEKSPFGHITRYEYDDVGNLLREISPADGQRWIIFLKVYKFKLTL
ncbi:hypothetical protein GMW39_18235 [Pectobacterium parmentieri]|nr:hypothetical protein [Pectobacterium parmentieri]AYG99623.1 hypothetical protein C5E26_00795 [Pectobacterium parmentieri]AYH04050.1 hypothetical protein C5E25_00820 [Pectobacterium parmentieri]AYH12871.1 hypothetical protein C5E23_00805 [Pectobacterium parmentieri]AYH21574.1 hypothetical protein C5E21_00800 [Pectobacterium parmentieri]AYH25862.1 hypothetical protein C5E20_01000 [Pectobacterium parmentieri]